MKKPIYNDKVNRIIEMLKFKTRDEVAKEFNYKTYKSLDMYMRRKNFRYDSEEGQYYPMETRIEKPDPKSYAPTKVASIIAAFEEEGMDPKVIAKQEGFKDHREMAEYMKIKGYEWNVYKNNYVKIVGRIVEEADDGLPSVEPINKQEVKGSMEGIEEYIPFIRFLYEKRDDIYQLISGTREDGQIPRYAIPGLVRTKAIYMSDTIAKLAGEFSREKNITQREVMEAALVEYLMKYGFKREVKALLKN